MSPDDGRELFAVTVVFLEWGLYEVVFIELDPYEVVFIDCPAKQNDLRSIFIMETKKMMDYICTAVDEFIRMDSNRVKICRLSLTFR